MRLWYGCMNEMLLPSGEIRKVDLSAFLKKSRNGINLARPGVLVGGGMGLRTAKSAGQRVRLLGLGRHTGRMPDTVLLIQTGHAPRAGMLTF
jgi:hypothetical protein